MKNPLTAINISPFFKRQKVTSQTTCVQENSQEYFRKIPKPHVPVFPVLSIKNFKFWSSKTSPSIIDNRFVEHFYSARYALYAALEKMSATTEHEILVPSYHCLAMIEPIIHKGCKVKLYNIYKDFSADLDDLTAKITPNTRAIIGVNYFGFIQNITAIKEICEERNIYLIEDCAHSFIGSYHQNLEQPMGFIGDYAIASSMKFFPIRYGGILVSKKDQGHPFSGKSGLKDNIKFIYQKFENAFQYNRLWILAPLFYVLEKIRGSKQQNDEPMVFDNSQNYQLNFLDERRSIKPSSLERFLINQGVSYKNSIRRQENYRFLTDKLSSLPGVEILLPISDNDEVPYLLPLYIENLEDIFPDIEDAGLPYQRFGQFLWSDETTQPCAVAESYSQKILQLPCHQALTKKELIWIIETLEHVLQSERRKK